MDKEIIYKIVSCTLGDKEILSRELFRTLTGVESTEVDWFLSNWPKVSIEDGLGYRIAQGTLANLLNYPHGKFDLLYVETGLIRSQIRALYEPMYKNIAPPDEEADQQRR